ncbi:hypothetical protein Pla163_09600 [Planctomycetes bacterium Pla163]|uniref:Thiol-disulfide oxidoreductase n=1 Tax=Rohdeia mirabilis TaxID=2528008 RepID=A0A518CXA9_9BACT|nr:hypothetical protein Pla163_09600 [Planctomycetes bacterium Pla163]
MKYHDGVLARPGAAALGLSTTAGLALLALVGGSVLASARDAVPQDRTDPQDVARTNEPVLDRTPKVHTARDARALGVGAYVADGTGTALDGTEVSWRRGAGERGTVVVLTSLTCPLCKKFAPAVARAEKRFTKDGFGFVHVGVSGLDTADALREHAAHQGLEGLVLSDADGALAEAFDAEMTTEVFVVDATGTLRYRGALSDQYGLGYALDAPRHSYLDDALTALIAGEEPSVVATSAPGCIVERAVVAEAGAASAEPVTYARHVSRLVQNTCLECHRTGGVAPFALESYEDVARRASMLLAVVEDGTMPPWFAARSHGSTDGDGTGSTFSNDRSLLPHEVEQLRAWVAAGKPEGDASELPAPRTFDVNGWELGEPDAVYALPEAFEVPAEGRVRYQYTAVPTGLERDRWVSGIEVRPGAVEVVHHVLVWAVPAEAFRDGLFVDWDRIDERRGFFAAWAPGAGPVLYPEGQAKFLPAGSVMMFEVHYTPNGRVTSDRSSIGVHFADDGPDWKPDHVVRVVGISNRGIEIPAGADAHAEHSSGVVARRMKIESFLPHMHLRGKSFRYELEGPDGTRRTLLEVPAYDFNWQLRYELARPLEVAPSSVLRIAGVFDNSRNNPANPDPGTQVGWGLQTEDEMLIGFVEYVLVDEDLALPADEPLILTFDPRTTDQLRGLAASNDGEVPRDRLRARFHPAFDLLDRDGDGRLDTDELPLLRPE